jgi:hypothetical protein
LFHLAEVDNTAPAGAKEDGAVQPALAVPESAPNEKLAVGKMDARKIPARFEKINVLDSHDPTFDIVSQENEIVTMKYGGLRSGAGDPCDSCEAGHCSLAGFDYLDKSGAFGRSRYMLAQSTAERRKRNSLIAFVFFDRVCQTHDPYQRAEDFGNNGSRSSDY